MALPSELTAEQNHDSAMLMLSTQPSIRRYYLVALVLTLALVGTSLVVLLGSTARQVFFTEFLSAVTRQSQYGLEVALYSAQLVDATDEQARDGLRQQLVASSIGMRAVHDSLVTGRLKSRAGLPVTYSDHALYFSGEPSTNALVVRFLTLADELALLPAEELTSQNLQCQQILALSPQILDRMNEIAKTYQAEVDRQSVAEYDREVAIMAFIVVMVLAQIPFIFIPMERRIRRQDAMLRREVEFQRGLAEDLRIAQGKLNAVLDSDPQAVTFFDKFYRIVRVNKVSAEIAFGISGRIPKPGDDVYGFIRPSIHDLLRTCFESALRGQTLQIENVVPISGGQRTFKMVFFPVMVDGKIDGGAFSMEDISERKQAERQAFELVSERERVRVLAGFVQAASHEFRTPLTIINSSAYMLERVVEDERGKQRAKLILEQTDHIMVLISALIRMAELDSATHLPIERINLTPILHAAVANIQTSFANRSVDLSIDVPSPLIAYVDASNIEYAITELISNAFSATPDGGKVNARLWTEQRSLFIEVRDTGSGLTPAQTARVFERFYRGDAARTTRGFGLGLSTVQRIARLHNGDIEVESEPGKGSVFRLVLPNLTFGEQPAP